MSSPRLFDRYAEVYDLLYLERDYLGDAEFICSRIPESLCSETRILELGCGSGRLAKIFCDRGFHVTGVDQSESMLSLAQARDIPKAEFSVGDIRTFNAQHPAEVAIALFHVFSYLLTDSDLQQALRQVHANLTPGGTLFFDVWNKSGVLTQGPEIRSHEVRTAERIVRKMATPELDRERDIVLIRFDFEIERMECGTVDFFEEIHPVRYFDTEFISNKLHETGFDVVEICEYPSGRRLADDSWGVFFAARKT